MRFFERKGSLVQEASGSQSKGVCFDKMEEGKELSIDHQDSGELEQQPGAAVSVEAKARPIDEKKVQGKMVS